MLRYVRRRSSVPARKYPLSIFSYSASPEWVLFRTDISVARGLAPGDIDDQLSKMTLLGHMRKRLKNLVECKFAIHHRGESVLLDEPIHVFKILARTGLDAYDIRVKTGKRQQVRSNVEAREHADLRDGAIGRQAL